VKLARKHEVDVDFEPDLPRHRRRLSNLRNLIRLQVDRIRGQTDEPELVIVAA
jgi:hypothetical protein